MATFIEHFSVPSDGDHLREAVDGRKLWTGGLVTAVIVGGLTIAGFLLFNGVLHYSLFGDRGVFGYAVGAALAALLATAVMHALLMTTPRPRWFFGWLAGIGTAIAVLLPLSQGLRSPLATAMFHLLLGLAIIGLVQSTTAASLRSDGWAGERARPLLRRRMLSRRPAITHMGG